MKEILIVIPAFNEAENIDRVVAGLLAFDDSYDVLVINDGSADKTGEIARAAGAVCIDLPFNMGIGNAVHTGYMYAHRMGYQYVVQFDGDGQHPTEGIAELIEILRSGKADVAIGSRFLTNQGFQSTASRRAGIFLLSALLRVVIGKRITDPTSGFRAINRRALELFYRYYPHDYPEPEAIVVAVKQRLKIVEVPVLMMERQGGTSSIRILNSIYYMIKVSLAIWIKSLRKEQQYACD